MLLKERFQNLAFKYFNQREFEKALKLVDRLLEENKEDFNLLLFKGDILAQMEDIENAQNYYISAIEKANKEKDNFKRVLALMKLKRIQGETNELNARIFISSYNLGLLKLCEDALEKLLREDVLEESAKFLERVINDVKKEEEGVCNFLKGILYLKIGKEEGKDFLSKAKEKIDEEEKLKNYKEFIEGISGAREGGIDLKELEDILQIEGLAERKLEPAGTLELADLLRSIGSQEEAILEYFSAIYGYISQENNIEKAKEILEKVKEMTPDDERIPKVQEFLEKIEKEEVKEEKEEKIEIGIDLMKKIFSEFLLPEENTDNWLSFLNLMSEWNMFEEIIDYYREIEEKEANVDLFAPHYLYSLYMIGEYEEVVEKADKFIEQTESEEVLKFLKYFKAVSLYKLENKEKALEILGSIYEQDPGFLDVKDYMEEKRPEEVTLSEKILEEEKEEEVVEIEEVIEEKAEPVEVIEEVEPVEEPEPEVVEIEEKEAPVQAQEKAPAPVMEKKPLKEHFIII